MRIASITTVVALLVACRAADTTVSDFNGPPAVTITQPAAGSGYGEGDAIEFRATVVDDGGVDQVTVSWVSDIDGALTQGDSVSDPNGNIELVTASLGPGNHIITLTAIDSEGLSGDDFVEVSISGDPDTPSIDILSPVNGEAGGEGIPFEFSALVSDAQDEPEDLVVTITSDVDGLICTVTPNVAGIAECEEVASAGQHTLIFEVTDLDTQRTSAQVIFSVISGDDVDDDGDGFTEAQGDCDDNDQYAYPGADEVQNGRDDDCDGIIDEGGTTFDNDGDCYCAAGPCTGSIEASCASVDEGDCDDSDILVNPLASDEPDINFIDSNCDGMDGDPAYSVFVNSSNGSDSRDGLTAGTAVESLDKAYQVANSSGRSWIVANGSSLTLSGDFQQGVNLAGGYTGSAAPWARSASRARVNVSRSGATISGWSQPTEWQYIEVESASTGSFGRSSIALTINNTTDLSLYECAVRGGDAGRGSDGFDGAAGSNGGNGAKGGNGCEDGDWLCPSGCSRPSAGSAGGAGSGSGVCISNAGGGGGRPGHGTGRGDNGAAGRSASGHGSAGPAGSGGSGDSPGTGGSTLDGGDGAHGGAAGTGGLGMGQFALGGYTASDGTDGRDAKAGGGAGGGGGGGGGNSVCDSFGGGGGGGGGGGCGGTGGRLGTGGGASVGIVMIDSVVTLQGGTVATGAGGAGGRGGTGMLGGTGGSPGASTVGEDDSGGGAAGGRGGDGGNGTHGGGGGGGPSIGIVCLGTTVLIESGVVVSPGAGGSAGSSSGANGAAGRSAERDGC